MAPYLTSLTASLGASSEGPLTPSNPHIAKQYPKTLDGGENPSWSTWEENWGHVVRPLILSDVNL
ncbi:hypothetical protein GALMADRAFT_233951 [Galerina marginata CBS 339.88]|uniref:Uncharacterized protein n=1 Tax=Galerina marginata (strain CBS 339.88) TaxID=685588 RepID=A0A067TPV9_GALM3|nr:hypothetical protein GALMADRAFT_233951 [Galerina marginata CBS 339.88]